MKLATGGQNSSPYLTAVHCHLKVNIYGRLRCIFRAQVSSPCSSVVIMNEGISAAYFCHQVAAWFTEMFCNFYLVKNHKIAINSTPTKAEEG
jgi:hypothetical protein